MPVHSFKCLASVVLSQLNSSKIKMVAGGHLDFDNDHNTSRVNDNSTLNKMTPVWRKSVKQFWSYRIYYVLASCHLYGWENEGWQKLNVTRIKDTSVLSKMTPVWSRYLKRLKSHSILMAKFFDIAWHIDFYCHEVHLCQRGSLYLL
jgi:hypothetical protein